MFTLKSDSSLEQVPHVYSNKGISASVSFILSSVISIFDIPKLIQKLYSIDYGSIENFEEVGWVEKAYLSLGGRITLIQSCLSHIPSYFVSLFKIPVSIASKIKKMQKDFLWSGAGEGKKDHFIRWEVVSRPKELGGLGFGKISMRNIALLGKWLWRFPRERSGLWHKVIASIYGTHPNGWDANTVLCSQFADLYRVVSMKNLTVSNVLGNSLPLSWNFKFKSVVFVFVRLVFSEIFFLGLVKSLKSFNVLPAKFLWSSKVPSKVKALAWLVAHGKTVNTNDKLQLRRPYKALCPQWCILCKGNGESIDHLFLHCPVTIGLWHRMFNLVGLVWIPLRSLEDMLVITFKGLGNSLRCKTLWQIACLTLIWMVWQKRNNRIFEDKGRTEEMVWDLIRFYSSLWASCTEAFRGVPLNILQLNWIGEIGKKEEGTVSTQLKRRGRPPKKLENRNPEASSEGRAPRVSFKRSQKIHQLEEPPNYLLKEAPGLQ
ncbi:putative ribonuclease H protein [Vitis vinifera]|uniref:Putative ribonuclease H protein n=1 Tax=Vitis vinifera TaxID=29760 RepID=A0A438E1J8_VITVI|nr:putative ribonuclease H protein [Vitis vinifera]